MSEGAMEVMRFLKSSAQSITFSFGHKSSNCSRFGGRSLGLQLSSVDETSLWPLKIKDCGITRVLSAENPFIVLTGCWHMSISQSSSPSSSVVSRVTDNRSEE